MRGRKPIPDRLPAIALAEDHDAAGNDPPTVRDRALQVAEPFCPEPVRECDDAMACWNRLVPELVQAGLITPIFEGMLAAYCTVFARWMEAERELRRTSMLVKSPTGYPLQNPWLAISNRAIEQMRQLSGELGLSASALTRVSRAVQGELFEEVTQAEENNG